jgi:hypothetical protein
VGEKRLQNIDLDNTLTENCKIPCAGSLDLSEAEEREITTLCSFHDHE